MRATLNGWPRVLGASMARNLLSNAYMRDGAKVTILGERDEIFVFMVYLNMRWGWNHGGRGRASDVAIV